jgi:hypothetical protein
MLLLGRFEKFIVLEKNLLPYSNITLYSFISTILYRCTHFTGRTFEEFLALLEIILKKKQELFKPLKQVILEKFLLDTLRVLFYANQMQL